MTYSRLDRLKDYIRRAIATGAGDEVIDEVAEKIAMMYYDFDLRDRALGLAVGANPGVAADEVVHAAGAYEAYLAKTGATTSAEPASIAAAVVQTIGSAGLGPEDVALRRECVQAALGVQRLDPEHILPMADELYCYIKMERRRPGRCRRDQASSSQAQQ